MTTNERFKFQSSGWYATSLVTLLLLAAVLSVGRVYQQAAFENQLAALNQQIAKLDKKLSEQIATVDEKHTQAIAELSKVHDDFSNQIAAVDEKQTQAAAELSKFHDNLSNQIAAVDEKHTQAIAQLARPKKSTSQSPNQTTTVVFGIFIIFSIYVINFYYQVQRINEYNGGIIS
jgi:DNA anti-recombination protein RmuC